MRLTKILFFAVATASACLASEAGAAVTPILVNGTAGPVTQLTLDYDLTVSPDNTKAEQVYGNLVYYSLSGAANTWVQFPGGPQPDNTLGTFHKTLIADLTATPWGAGSNLYVLWADD